jgi:hypothetical protein
MPKATRILRNEQQLSVSVIAFLFSFLLSLWIILQSTSVLAASSDRKGHIRFVFSTKYLSSLMTYPSELEIAISLKDTLADYNATPLHLTILLNRKFTRDDPPTGKSESANLDAPFHVDNMIISFSSPDHIVLGNITNHDGDTVSISSLEVASSEYLVSYKITRPDFIAGENARENLYCHEESFSLPSSSMHTILLQRPTFFNKYRKAYSLENMDCSAEYSLCACPSWSLKKAPR